MKLYDYFRSSAAYRVRIALNLKGLEYDREFVHLTRGGGEQFSEQYGGVNPQNLVPALDDDGQVLTQSLAIIQYLEETRPKPALLPSTPLERARVSAERASSSRSWNSKIGVGPRPSGRGFLRLGLSAFFFCFLIAFKPDRAGLSGLLESD